MIIIILLEIFRHPNANLNTKLNMAVALFFKKKEKAILFKWNVSSGIETIHWTPCIWMT